jgi:cytoskeleton protein RodZ
MTQDISTSSDSQASDLAVDVSPSSHATAGALLRTYREAQGLKIDNLASLLKVPVSKLESLEHDRLDELPDTMFARALTLAVCRVLKADAAPVLALLPGQDVSRLAPKDERGIDFPLQRPSFLPQSKLMTTASLFTPMRGGAILALLVALALVFLPDLQVLFASKETPTPAEVVPVVSPVEPTLPTPTEPAVPTKSTVVPESSAANMVVTPVQSMAAPAATPAVTQLPASGSGAANVR